MVGADKTNLMERRRRVSVSISNRIGTGLIAASALLVTLCLVWVGVGSRDSGGESQEEETGGGASCIYWLRWPSPWGSLQTERGRGEGTHLEVTSVQILNPASLRTAFELSMG